MPTFPAPRAWRAGSAVLAAFGAAALLPAQDLDRDISSIASDLKRLEVELAAGDPAAGDACAQQLIAKGEASASWILLNGVAWSIVDPHAEVGRRNLDLARRAVTLAGEFAGAAEPHVLDTLARVHAWEGDIEKAAAVQQRALALLPKSFMRGFRGVVAESAIEYGARLRAAAPPPAKAGPRVPAGCAPATAAVVDGWCKVVVHKATGVRLRFVAGGEYIIGMAPGDLDGLATSAQPEAPPYETFGEQPQRRVRVSPFYLAECEVSVEQWRKFAAATGYLTDAELDAAAVTALSLRFRKGSVKVEHCDLEATWVDPLPFFRAHRKFTLADAHPVTMVTWNDAMMFCALNGLRLPTEAEWEFAARGGSAARYWWGADPADGKDKDNLLDVPGPDYPLGATPPMSFPFHDGNCFYAPVDAFAPNPLGLRGTLGNVREWCADPGNFHPYDFLPADAVAVDPVMARVRDESQLYVARGGVWNSPPVSARVSARTLVRGPTCCVTIGFRPALKAN
jgi:formylglycine-generating enzyme required for sulfatase activity